MRDALSNTGSIVDWDVYSGNVRNFRILCDDSDAESDETYFKYDRNWEAYVRNVRPGAEERERLDSWLEELEEPRPTWKPMEGDGGQATYVRTEQSDGGVEYFRYTLFSFGENEMQRMVYGEGHGEARLRTPTLPIGANLNFENLRTLMRYMPEVERERCTTIVEYHMFREVNLKQFMQMHLMKLHDKHPDLHWDHILWYDAYDRR